MAEDPEKRFERIMDKLYQFPKPKSQPLSGEASSSQRKRVELSSRGGAGSNAMGSKAGSASKEARPQTCRPWDRGDLMRRMATFKAMTWFGKPKVVNPANCARRGWVNVDMDTISCEACGSRLFFSTPSSWTFQQVENAAAVFSLKLDNGHKLLCPWIDNSCDESLASFPPMPSLELIEAYRRRSNALLQLSALPVISESALKYMKCQQLDDILDRSSTMTCILENGVKLVARPSVDGDVIPEAIPSSFYFKAQKIIGLCGWELRLLPYTVCRENSSFQNKTKGSSENSRQSSHGKIDAIIVSTENSMESMGRRENDPFSRFDFDPTSAALDCKLCGACVGLWAFDTIPRPLECFTLVDAPESDDKNESIIDASSNSAEPAKMQSDSNLITNRDNSNLKLSIAGGVPPTNQQNFRPSISLPIISRHLRVQLALASERKNCVSADTSTVIKVSPLNPEDNSLLLGKDKTVGCDLTLLAETTNGLKQKRDDEETCVAPQENSDLPSEVKGDIGLLEISRTEEIGDVSCEGRMENSHESDCASEITPAVISENFMDTLNNDSSGAEVYPMTGEHGGVISTEAHDSEITNMSSDAQTFTGFESHGDDLMPQLLDISRSNGISTGGSIDADGENPMVDPLCVEPCTATGDNTTLDLDRGRSNQTFAVMNASDQDAEQPEESLIDNNKMDAPFQKTGGKLLSEHGSAKAFDPLWHHRPFCPWIATESQGRPGWKLTLFALDREEGSPSPATEARKRLLSEKEDPIFSVRKLFETPSKRLKNN